MTFADTNTRPAGIGGIDLSGIDVAQAIFEATGGGYGTPRDSQPVTGGQPVKLPDWNTNGGNGPVSDHFDFSQPPADRDAEIKLLAEPEGSHPLLDLFKDDDQPVFANGGPDGTAFLGPAIVVLVIIAAIYLSGGCDGKPQKPEPAPDPELKKWEDSHFTDPDAVSETLPTPAEMMADLLGKSGMEGINLEDIGITDILAKLSDNLGKVTDLVAALKGAAQAGDGDAFGSALAELKQLAGLDDAGFDTAKTSAHEFLDGVLIAFGVAGGLDGAGFVVVVQGDGSDTASDATTVDFSDWLVTTSDYII